MSSRSRREDRLPLDLERLAERELERATSLNDRLIEAASFLLVCLDRDGKVVAVNEATERTTGFARSEIVNENWFEVAVPRSRYPDAWKCFRDFVESKGARGGEIGHPVLNKAGEERIIEWRNKYLGDAPSDSLVACYGIDVTENRKLDEQLVVLQKLESVARLAGGLAHDFNNLLTVINGYSEMLMSTLPEGSEGWDHSNEIRQAGERAAALTRKLLAFSKKQIMQPQPVNLTELIRTASSMLTTLAGVDAVLSFQLSDELWTVDIDAAGLEQVLVNLVLNAQEAMPHGGNITISALNDESRGSQRVLLRISDTGIGMGDATKERIFDPFFTTKGPGKGTGLGLAAVYGVVQQNSGEIRVDSELGQGTTFELSFPRSAARQPERKGRVLAKGCGSTILLVEDQSDVRKFTALALRQFGFQVLEADCAETAIAKAKSAKGPIQVVVTDVIMPGMKGPELADRLRKDNPALSVLFISGYPEDLMDRRGGLRPGEAFLAKPFDPRVLAHRLQELLDERGRGAAA